MRGIAPECERFGCKRSARLGRDPSLPPLCKNDCELGYAPRRAEVLMGQSGKEKVFYRDIVEQHMNQIPAPGASCHDAQHDNGGLNIRPKRQIIEKESSMQALQQLKSFDPAGYSIEEMVLLLGTANLMTSTFLSVGAEVPEWLKDANKALSKEIETRSRDMLEKELKELTAREEALKTKEEQRKELEAKRKRIEQRLNGAIPQPVAPTA